MPVPQVLGSSLAIVLLPKAGGVLLPDVVAGVWVPDTVPAVLPEAGGFTQPLPCMMVPGGQFCASAMLGAAKAAMIASVRSPLLMEQLQEGRHEVSRGLAPHRRWSNTAAR